MGWMNMPTLSLLLMTSGGLIALAMVNDEIFNDPKKTAANKKIAANTRFAPVQEVGPVGGEPGQTIMKRNATMNYEKVLHEMYKHIDEHANGDGVGERCLAKDLELHDGLSNPIALGEGNGASNQLNWKSVAFWCHFGFSSDGDGGGKSSSNYVVANCNKGKPGEKNKWDTKTLGCLPNRCIDIEQQQGWTGLKWSLNGKFASEKHRLANLKDDCQAVHGAEGEITCAQDYTTDGNIPETHNKNIKIFCHNGEIWIKDANTEIDFDSEVHNSHDKLDQDESLECKRVGAAFDKRDPDPRPDANPDHVVLPKPPWDKPDPDDPTPPVIDLVAPRQELVRCPKGYSLDPDKPDQKEYYVKISEAPTFGFHYCTSSECKAESDWIPHKKPECKPVNCKPDPVKTAGGETVAEWENDTTENKSVYQGGLEFTLRCKSGYELREAKKESKQSIAIHCLPTGQWSADPVCWHKGCQDEKTNDWLEEKKNSCEECWSFDGKNRDKPEQYTETIKCDPKAGWRRTDENKNIILEKAPQECKHITCDQPDFNTRDVFRGDGSTMDTSSWEEANQCGHWVKFICEIGFGFSGDKTKTKATYKCAAGGHYKRVRDDPEEEAEDGKDDNLVSFPDSCKRVVNFCPKLQAEGDELQFGWEANLCDPTIGGKLDDKCSFDCGQIEQETGRSCLFGSESIWCGEGGSWMTSTNTAVAEPYLQEMKNHCQTAVHLASCNHAPRWDAADFEEQKTEYSSIWMEGDETRKAGRPWACGTTLEYKCNHGAKIQNQADQKEYSSVKFECAKKQNFDADAKFQFVIEGGLSSIDTEDLGEEEQKNWVCPIAECGSPVHSDWWKERSSFYDALYKFPDYEDVLKLGDGTETMDLACKLNSNKYVANSPDSCALLFEQQREHKYLELTCTEGKWEEPTNLFFCAFPIFASDDKNLALTLGKEEAGTPTVEKFDPYNLRQYWVFPKIHTQCRGPACSIVSIKTAVGKTCLDSTPLGWKKTDTKSPDHTDLRPMKCDTSVVEQHWKISKSKSGNSCILEAVELTEGNRGLSSEGAVAHWHYLKDVGTMKSETEGVAQGITFKPLT